MSVGFVRFGGICAFLLIVACILLVAFAATNPALVQNRALMAVFLLVIYAFVAMVYLATKTLWNHFGRRGANIPIVFLVVMMVLFWVLNVVGAAGQVGMMAGPASGAVGIIVLVLTLLAVVAWIWFAIYCIVAGKEAGGIWRATGILYVLGTALSIIIGAFGAVYFTAMVMQGLRAGNAPPVAPHDVAMAGIVSIVGILVGLVMLAAWICHGIGLLTGAAKMERGE
jgi:hypothetical protein